MSWGTCYSGSNNIHNDFPAIMTDGRTFTSWQHGSAVNESIRKSQNIKTSSDYRQYLMNNSEGIIKNNRASAYRTCCGYVNTYQKNSSNVPYLYTSINDNSQPFGYENSDLKKLYLSRQQLQSKTVTPFIRVSELDKFAI